ncbi:hypothetical protein BM535_17870, partial [Clostridioides difficile]
KIMLPNSDSESKDSVDLIRDSLFSIQVEQPWLLLQSGTATQKKSVQTVWKLWYRQVQRTRMGNQRGSRENRN